MDISTIFKNGGALRTNLPKNVCQALDLKSGDPLHWYVHGNTHVHIYRTAPTEPIHHPARRAK